MKKAQVSRVRKFFLLTPKKVLITVVAWFLAVILHNLIYAVLVTFNSNIGDEAFFFIIAVFLIPLYFIIAIIYTTINYFKKLR